MIGEKKLVLLMFCFSGISVLSIFDLSVLYVCEETGCLQQQCVIFGSIDIKEPAGGKGGGV